SIANGLGSGPANARRSRTDSDATGAGGKTNPDQVANPDAAKTPWSGKANGLRSRLDRRISALAGGDGGVRIVGLGQPSCAEQFATSMGFARRRDRPTAEAIGEV